MKPDIAGGEAGFHIRREHVMQVVTMLTMSMNYFVMGMVAVFAGIFTEQLTSPDADITLSVSQISWVCSIFSIGNMLGSLAASYVNPLLGAIRVCQLCAPMVAGGCLLIAYGYNFWVLFTGRLLLGFFNGITVGPSSTHIGEIASPRLRGFLTSSLVTMMTLGLTFTYLAGWLLGWRRMTLWLGITPMVLMFVATLMLPRSPRWLITKGYPVEEAERSMRFYFGQDYDVDKAVKNIQESLGGGHKHKKSFLQVLALLRYRHILIPLFLINMTNVLLVFSGGYTTTVFAPVIFKSVGWFSQPYLSSITVGVVRIVGAILCSVSLTKLHRRTLIVVNGVVGGIGCLVAGFYFFYRDQLADYAWVPLASVLIIVFVMSLGLASLKNVLLSELLPNSIRSEFGGICSAMFGISSFIMVQTFYPAVQAVGMSGVYWFFTLMHLLMFAFAMFCLPDTNGKTIEEIQKMFMKKTAGAAAAQADIRAVNESAKPKESINKSTGPVTTISLHDRSSCEKAVTKTEMDC